MLRMSTDCVNIYIFLILLDNIYHKNLQIYGLKTFTIILTVSKFEFKLGSWGYIFLNYPAFKIGYQVGDLGYDFQNYPVYECFFISMVK